MEQETIIAVGVLGGCSLLLLVLVAVLFAQGAALRRRLSELQLRGTVPVQKLTLENDKNHAFHNPAISPDEELARRGFSMYAADQARVDQARVDQPRDADVESARSTERQTGGQFVEELSRELDYRHQRREEQQRHDRQLRRLEDQQHQHRPDEQQARQHRPDEQQAHQHRPDEQQARQHRPDEQQAHQHRPDEQQARHNRQHEEQRNRQQQQPPPFLLQSIEENKRRSRSLANPVANGGRQSETNPNFIY